MTSFLNSLRADLNRDRAYVRSVRENIDEGFNVSYGTKVLAGIRHNNAVAIRKTIKALKEIRPVYSWQAKDNTQQICKPLVYYEFQDGEVFKHNRE